MDDVTLVILYCLDVIGLCVAFYLIGYILGGRKK